MQIAFRVDASATIGTGHIMRCLTLADALKKRGAACTFISRHLPSYLQDIIESRGHQTIRIDKYGTKHPGDELPHAHFLGTSQSQDAADSQLTLESLQPNWLIIDHYGIDQRWESALRPFAKKILVIDDLADRSHDCDLLVDQNLYEDMASRYSGLLPTTAKALLGTKYAMLRPEFSDARKLTKPREGAIRRLFIFFGGMDSANFTLPILDALVGLKLRDIAVDVVIGSEHPIREKVERVCQEHVFGCHVQTKRMAKLLLKADAAIGAGGSTSWERCCLGLPSLAFIVAPNQKALTLHANHLGLLKAATADIQDAEELSNELQLFLDADEARGRMSRECLAAVDAHGANRIVDQMLATRPQLRPAVSKDSSLLFEWRNHPSIREISTKPEPIPWASHEKWFNSVLEDNNRILYIAEDNDSEVGVIRFDIESKQAEVSLYLAPDQKGKGLGTQLLLSAEREVLKTRPELLQFLAIVLEGNEASHRLFKRCGYRFDDSLYIKNI